jgi:NADH pyrophosphatase NudC (nudix superfamily)
MATRAEVIEHENALRRDIEALRVDLKRDLREAELWLEAKIAETNIRIAETKADLTRWIVGAGIVQTASHHWRTAEGRQAHLNPEFRHDRHCYRCGSQAHRIQQRDRRICQQCQERTAPPTRPGAVRKLTAPCQAHAGWNDVQGPPWDRQMMTPITII